MSAADKEPPGWPDFALCTAVTIPLRTSFAVFFNAKVSPAGITLQIQQYNLSGTLQCLLL